ncbi:MAG: class I SAM-dependent methyltransferase, partial [Acidimicrobiales bacterium]
MLAHLLRDLLGDDLSVAVSTWDGERAGPADASATVVIRSPKAVARMVQAPGQLGLARAYVAGDIDVEGDIFAVVEAVDALEAFRLSPAQWVQLARTVGPGVLRRLPAPAEEAHLRGRRHSRARDRAAIAYHYDVSNEFFRTILGPSMTYSCALFTDRGVTLEEAQSAKHELICRKLGLQPRDRLLDIGCGWGALVSHAARHHDVHALGVTLSAAQVEWAAKTLVENDLTDRATVRFQDYREVTGGPFDAVSSVGMSEHVGRAQLHTYFEKLFRLVRPGG